MAQDTGSDLRTSGFFIIDNEIVTEKNLGPYAGWLYVVIVSHINQKTGVAFPSLATLAKEAGMSEPTVIKYMTVLIESNLLCIHQTQDDKGEYSQNYYEILPVKGVVKDVNQGSKPDLPGVVKEVKSNNTNINKTKEQDEKKKDDNNSDPVASSESPTPPPEKQEPEKPSRSRQSDPDLAKVSKAYENEIGMITQYVAGKLAEACDDYPTDWIVEAIGRAVEQNKRKWSYVNGILQNWRVEGKAEKPPNGSKPPALSPPDPNCPTCGGLGWYNVKEAGGGSHAETCECRKAVAA